MTSTRAPKGETVREHYMRTGKVLDEDLTTPEHLLHAGRGRRIAEQLPGAARLLTQFAVDNPGQCAVVVAGTIVATRLAVNAIRPRTPLEALATLVIVNVAIPWGMAELVRRDVISFRVRDGIPGSYISLGDILRGPGEDRVHPAG